MITQCFSSEDSSHRRIFEWNDAQRKIIEARFAGTLGPSAKPKQEPKKKPAVRSRQVPTYQHTPGKKPTSTPQLKQQVDVKLSEKVQNDLARIAKLITGQGVTPDTFRVETVKDAAAVRNLQRTLHGKSRDSDARVDGKLNDYTKAKILVRFAPKKAVVPSPKKNPDLMREKATSVALKNSGENLLKGKGAKPVPGKPGVYLLRQGEHECYYVYRNGEWAWASKTEFGDGEKPKWEKAGEDKFTGKTQADEIANALGTTLKRQKESIQAGAKILQNATPQDDGSFVVEMNQRKVYYTFDERWRTASEVEKEDKANKEGEEAKWNEVGAKPYDPVAEPEMEAANMLAYRLKAVNESQDRVLESKIGPVLKGNPYPYYDLKGYPVAKKPTYKSAGERRAAGIRHIELKKQLIEDCKTLGVYEEIKNPRIFNEVFRRTRGKKPGNMRVSTSLGEMHEKGLLSEAEWERIQNARRERYTQDKEQSEERAKEARVNALKKQLPEGVKKETFEAILAKCPKNAGQITNEKVKEIFENEIIPMSNKDRKAIENKLAGITGTVAFTTAWQNPPAGRRY